LVNINRFAQKSIGLSRQHSFPDFPIAGDSQPRDSLEIDSSERNSTVARVVGKALSRDRNIIKDGSAASTESGNRKGPSVSEKSFTKLHGNVRH
jgi:hypothetical protein